MLSFLGVAILICECAIECCSIFKMWIMFLYFLANMLCSSQKCFASQGPKWSLTILNPFLSRSTAHQAFPFSKIMHYVVSAYKAGPAVLELNTRKKLACQPTQCKEKTVCKVAAFLQVLFPPPRPACHLLNGNYLAKYVFSANLSFHFFWLMWVCVSLCSVRKILNKCFFLCIFVLHSCFWDFTTDLRVKNTGWRVRQEKAFS